MRIVFWLPGLSMHFSAVIRGLGDLGHQVTVVSREEMQPHRQAMGWFVPDFGGANLILGPADDQIHDIVRQTDTDSIHILLGIRGRFSAAVIRACIRCRRRAGVYIEAPHPDGLMLPLKWAAYTAQRFTRGRALQFILPLGRVGAQWYRHCGYAQRHIFPCAYVPDFVPNAVEASDVGDGGGKCRILFLGRCIPIKRVDLLLRALACLSATHWLCTIIGDGPKGPDWQRLTGQLGLADHVRFVPSLPHAEAMAMLRRSDLLVLPSSHEGWGVVVNEALMSGVPAICSDRCGAADILTEDWRGGVFRAGSVQSLTRALEKWTLAGTTNMVLRKRIQEWSKCISSRAVAQYIVNVLKCVYDGGPRPSLPWFREFSSLAERPDKSPARHPDLGKTREKGADS